MIDTLITTNPDGSIKSVSQAVLDLLGYKESELLGQYITILFLQKEGLFFGKTYKEFLLNGMTDHGETTFRAKDGRAIPVLLSATVMRDEDDRIQGISCVAKDMTKIKQGEWQLRLQAAALESAANAIVLTNQKGRIVWANPSFIALTGYSLEEVIGQNMSILQSGRQNQAFYQNLWATILSGKAWHGEIVNRRKDGTLFTDEQTITPLYNQSGVINHFLSIGQDVTKRKEGEEALKKTHGALEQLDKMRSQFLANITHELRTPLTVIRGEAEVTMRGKDKPLAEYKAVLERIVQLTNQVNRLVGDLLFLSQSESGTIEIVKRPVQLSDILLEACQEMQVLAEEKHITVNLHNKNGTFPVAGDAQRLRQLILIILDNAVHYTREDGTIELSIEAQEAYCKVVVADNGIGISEQDLPHVFQRFYRAKQMPQNLFPNGSGLGLPIAKWIAEAHEGTISIASVLDRGTTVTITIPLHGLPPPPAGG
jgi:PAS domain S-box-containing protein